MKEVDDSVRKNLADKLRVDEELIEDLGMSEISFMLYHGKPRRFFEISKNGKKLNVALKNRLMKDYFKVAEEDSGEYKGKVWNGRLNLTLKEFRYYVNLRKLN